MGASDVIAIIALIISVVTATCQIIHERRQNTTNLNAYYFNEIYRDYLIHKIPNARKYISINQHGKLIGCQDMINEMKNIQSDSLYYKYTDGEYFSQLSKAAQGLEDFLIMSSGDTYAGEEVTDFMIKLQNLISKLYKVVNEKYIK